MEMKLSRWNMRQRERDQNTQVMVEEEIGDENERDEMERDHRYMERDQSREIMVEEENGDENEPMEHETESERLKTKLCVAILKTLGRDTSLDLILSLDGIRHKLKHEKPTEEGISQHKHYLCKIKGDLKNSFDASN